MEQLAALDANILLFIQDNIRNPVLTAIMRPITHLGDKGIFWIILTLILLAFRKTRKAGICSMFALLFMVVLNNGIIKHLVDRIRPYEVIQSLEILVTKPDDASFPSGHTASSFASCTALLLSLPMVTDRRRARIFTAAAYVLAILIALSRLYVGVHYPSDVLGGLVIGVLCGIAGYYAGKAVIAYLQKRTKLLPQDAQTGE